MSRPPPSDPEPRPPTITHYYNLGRSFLLVESGGFIPRNGKVFLSETAADTFVRGADVARGAAFSIEVDVATAGARVTRAALPGNPRAIVIAAAGNVSATVRRLFVRRPDGEGGFTVQVIEGAQAIKGLVAPAEVAAALAAHVHSWLMDRTGRAWHEARQDRDWTDFQRDLETALFE